MSNITINSMNEDNFNDIDFQIDTVNLMPGSNFTFSLYGENWKSIPINPFPLDSNTVFQVFSKVDSISSIQGIGFSDGERNIKYSFLEMNN